MSRVIVPLSEERLCIYITTADLSPWSDQMKIKLPLLSSSEVAGVDDERQACSKGFLTHYWVNQLKDQLIARAIAPFSRNKWSALFFFSYLAESPLMHLLNPLLFSSVSEDPFSGKARWDPNADTDRKHSSVQVRKQSNKLVTGKQSNEETAEIQVREQTKNPVAWATGLRRTNKIQTGKQAKVITGKANTEKGGIALRHT